MMGTEILEFQPLEAKKMRFKVSELMSKNMTKSIFTQTQ